MSHNKIYNMQSRWPGAHLGKALTSAWATNSPRRDREDRPLKMPQVAEPKPWRGFSNVADQRIGAGLRGGSLYNQQTSDTGGNTKEDIRFNYTQLPCGLSPGASPRFLAHVQSVNTAPYHKELLKWMPRHHSEKWARA